MCHHRTFSDDMEKLNRRALNHRTRQDSDPGRRLPSLVTEVLSSPGCLWKVAQCVEMPLD